MLVRKCLSASSALLLAIQVSLVSCGGKGGGNNNPLPLMIRCNTSGMVASNEIGLDCASQAEPMKVVTVEIGGPTTSTDVYGITFDIVFDPTIVRYEPPALEGTFLNKGGNTILQAGLQPGDDGRLVVSISLQATPSGVQAVSLQEPVVSIAFAALMKGTTTMTFENGGVADSSTGPIVGISFTHPLSITVE